MASSKDREGRERRGGGWEMGGSCPGRGVKDHSGPGSGADRCQGRVPSISQLPNPALGILPPSEVKRWAMTEKAHLSVRKEATLTVP